MNILSLSRSLGIQCIHLPFLMDKRGRQVANVIVKWLELWEGRKEGRERKEAVGAKTQSGEKIGDGFDHQSLVS